MDLLTQVLFRTSANMDIIRLEHLDSFFTFTHTSVFWLQHEINLSFSFELIILEMFLR